MATTRDQIIDILRHEGFESRAGIVADRIARAIPGMTLEELRQRAVSDAMHYSGGTGLDQALVAAARLMRFIETGETTPPE
jgi:hypothetical protein